MSLFGHPSSPLRLGLTWGFLRPTRPPGLKLTETCLPACLPARLSACPCARLQPTAYSLPPNSRPAPLLEAARCERVKQPYTTVDRPCTHRTPHTQPTNFQNPLDKTCTTTCTVASLTSLFNTYFHINIHLLHHNSTSTPKRAHGTQRTFPPTSPSTTPNLSRPPRRPRLRHIHPTLYLARTAGRRRALPGVKVVPNHSNGDKPCALTHVEQPGLPLVARLFRPGRSRRPHAV